MQLQNIINTNSSEGFLTGYSAGNISANTSDLILHQERISSFLQELKIEIGIWKASTIEIVKQIDDIQRYIDSDEKLDVITYFKSLFDRLDTFFTLLIVARKNYDLPANSEFILRKLIYHFLVISDKLKDNDINAKAIRIVQKYETI